LATLVITTIASTSRNPPKVIWPIDSEDDRIRCKNAPNPDGMAIETGSRRLNIARIAASREPAGIP
jgi:hypothetical protein